MMGNRGRVLSRKLGLAMGLVLVLSVAVPGVSTAAAPLFNQCPATGPDSGCGVLITVDAHGVASVAVDSSQPPLTADAVLVGVVNDSNVTLENLALTGGNPPGTFALVTGEGYCSVSPLCYSTTEYGPTSYEGPGQTFNITDSTHGTISFNGGIAPQRSTVLSLRDAPSGVAASLSADIVVTSATLTPYTNVPFSGTVATFTDGVSTAPTTEFTATTNWGDGTTTTSSVSQPGGTGTPYVVTDSNLYGTPGTYPVTVTVTDTVTTAIVNSGSDTVNATVVTQPVTISGTAIADQVTGTPFNGTVATFTDAVPGATASDFPASIDWGAESGGVEQTSTGTVTGPSGPNNQFTVTGSNNYTASGDFTIQVTVTYQNVPTTIGVPIVVDFYQAPPVTCSGTCSSVVPPPPPPGSPPSLQTSTVDTNSSVGSITAGIADGTTDGTLDCGTGPGGVGYDHAPQITTEVTSGIPSSTLVKVKVTFLRSNLVITNSNPTAANVGVCFEANTAFTPAPGWTLTTLQVPVSNVFPTGQAYVGLLPTCAPPYTKSRPCVGKVSKSVPGWKTVQENIRFYAGDPRHI